MRYAAAAVVIVVVFGLGGLGGYVLHGQDTLRNLGVGGDSCGTWLADRRQDDGAASWAEIIKNSWVNGYLTGLQEYGLGLSQSQARDLEGRAAWIDNYCQSNPLSNLRVAAWALYTALKSP